MAQSLILSAKALMKALSSITLTCVASAAAAKALMCNMGQSQHTDYFALFALQPTFAVDTAALAVTYRQLATDVHAGRFANATAAEQRQAVERAAELNDAFPTSKSPTQRALNLLRQQAEMPEETTIQAGEFLLQQMEWREQLEDLQEQADLQALERFVGELKQARSKIDNAFALCIEDRSEEHTSELQSRPH